MYSKQRLHPSFLALSLICFGGCGNDSRVKRLDEKAILAQEQVADQARQHYYRGQYDQAAPIIEPLCRDRTPSQPLYLCELGASRLACNDKAGAKQYLMDAYSSIEEFFDPTAEKKAVSLWGAEVEKVYKGDPYEQATLSLLLGLILLEEGDIDNALACFKNGQLADSDVESEEYKSDYGLLQLLEARCYQMRGQQAAHDELLAKAIDSFAKTHPLVHDRRDTLARRQDDGSPVEEKMEELRASLIEAETLIRQGEATYYAPLIRPYNTLLLVWTGRSPVMDRTGQYGEQRVVIKSPTPAVHFEVEVDDAAWHDVIRGFGDVAYQATTRGGRGMDNVLADQASFKRTTANIGNAFWDAADDVSDPYAAIALLALGAISHSVSAATNVKADIRCWKTLPEQFAVVPLQLAPGRHKARVCCYNNCLRLCRSVDYEFTVDARPFQFYNLVVPTMEPIETPQEEQAETTASL